MTAPEFPTELDWINTLKPLRISDLRGKVVLLDFWTYCCINCMHILPDLKKLEEEFGDRLVVIGVHSGKFTQEGDTDNIRQAIGRYGITHPVVNDRRFLIWQAYGVRAWPTLVLIDPQGRIVMQASGEGVYERFNEPIRRLIKDLPSGSASDLLSVIKPEPSQPLGEVLAYPGKVAVSPEGDLLFISDQNHNRILVVSLPESSILAVIGSGVEGFKDGDWHTAQFRHPQGIALVGNALYIADTDNHAIRVAQLSEKSVSTLWGTGRQLIFPPSPNSDNTPADLSSPWDIVADPEGEFLYIAMAGTHQIWRFNLLTGQMRPYAGSGLEGIIDGKPARAALAQPSGLVYLHERVYFVDSEASAVRYIDLNDEGEVKTIVGLDLFEFGDKDGKGDEVRLQHPLGITSDGQYLYIADTYNNKVKRIDPRSSECLTLVGTGRRGLKDGGWSEAELWEPGGVAYSQGKIYIADTNNHRIRVADIPTQTIHTWEIDRPAINTEVLYFHPSLTLPQGKVSGHLRIELSQSYGLNPQAPLKVEIEKGEGLLTILESFPPPFPSELNRDLTFLALQGEGVVWMKVSFLYCDKNDARLCFTGGGRIRLPLKVVPGIHPVSNIPLELRIEVVPHEI